MKEESTWTKLWKCGYNLKRMRQVRTKVSPSSVRVPVRSSKKHNRIPSYRFLQACCPAVWSSSLLFSEPAPGRPHEAWTCRSKCRVWAWVHSNHYALGCFWAKKEEPSVWLRNGSWQQYLAPRAVGMLVWVLWCFFFKYKSHFLWDSGIHRHPRQVRSKPLEGVCGGVCGVWVCGGSHCILSSCFSFPDCGRFFFPDSQVLSALNHNFPPLSYHRKAFCHMFEYPLACLRRTFWTTIAESGFGQNL